jgi:uncharacterized membrane protein YebE (DUF533 family)
MAFKDLLDQMLTAGKNMAAQGQAYAEQHLNLDQMVAAGKDAVAKGQTYAEQHLNIPPAGPERDAMLANLGKGALAGGALAAILGTRAGRKLGGTAAALGGLGLLGKVAADAYKSWQAGQGGDASAGTSLAALPEAAAEQRSQLLLRAMIAAANADGHIDESERGAIQATVTRLGLENDERLFIEAQLSQPASPAEIAQGADTPEAASEVYLASLFVIDVDDPRERAYLDELAAALHLAPGLAQQLEAQAASV